MPVAVLRMWYKRQMLIIKPSRDFFFFPLHPCTSGASDGPCGGGWSKRPIRYNEPYGKRSASRRVLGGRVRQVRKDDVGGKKIGDLRSGCY